MIKYFCDNCKIEVKQEHLKKFFDPSDMKEFEYCEDCHEIYKEVSKRIKQRSEVVKKEALKKFDQIRKEEMEGLKIKK